MNEFSQEKIDPTDLNKIIIQKFQNITHWININSISIVAKNNKHFEKMKYDQGGFNHHDMSNLYSKLQCDPRYSKTRLLGYRNIFSLLLNDDTSIDNNIIKPLIIDFLAGSGTVSKRVKQLFIKNIPYVIGLDVSSQMCINAYSKKEIVFWSRHDSHLFRDNIADYVLAAYGFHHVPVHERTQFVNNMKKTLKKGGICLLHDFDEVSASSRFYSELIDINRPCGHKYQHFSSDSMRRLLSTNFNDYDVQYIYDPFYLESKMGQNEKSLKKEFFTYIISLFNLKKLLPKNYSYNTLIHNNNSVYWDEIEKTISPYLSLSEHEIKKVTDFSDLYLDKLASIKVPLVNNLSTISLGDGRFAIIGPRVALIGHGKKT